MRLIDADALRAKAFVDIESGEPFIGLQELDEAPTIEATPVVHGRWEDKPTGRYGQQQSWCSACRKHSGIGGIEKNRHRAYCPNCGAKMDGSGEESVNCRICKCCSAAIIGMEEYEECPECGLPFEENIHG